MALQVGSAAREAGEDHAGMADDAERFREISSWGVIPSPSGAGAVVIQDEAGPDCRVVLIVHRPADRARKVAIVTLTGCL